MDVVQSKQASYSRYGINYMMLLGMLGLAIKCWEIPKVTETVCIDRPAAVMYQKARTQVVEVTEGIHWNTVAEH